MIDPERRERLEAVQARIMGAVRDELVNGECTPAELLAVMAYSTGGCMAFQDQRKMTAEQAMALIQKNMEAGNKSAVQQILGGATGAPGMMN